MEADLHNLTPTVGEVNGDRSNYNFGVLPSTAFQHGACSIKIDFSQRTAEPPDEIKGQIPLHQYHLSAIYCKRIQVLTH
jgi:deoxyribonuclease-1